jgi:hypothetical protein
MMHYTSTVAWLGALGLSALLAGCAGPETPSQSTGRGAPADQPGSGSATLGAAESQPTGQFAEAFAKLSETERAIARKQETCPVSGEPLGSMGAPYKVSVKGRDVFLCCEGCEDAVLKDPDTYLAKLPK